MLSQLNVFISYAHKDLEESLSRTRYDWLEQLKILAAPLARQGSLDIWSDTQLEMGQKFHVEIQEAVNRADAAILFVGKYFMASDYIVRHELPVILKRELSAQSVPIIVVVNKCAFSEAAFKYPDHKHGPHSVSLSDFQAANSPNSPMDRLSIVEQEDILHHVMRQLHKLSEKKTLI